MAERHDVLVRSVPAQVVAFYQSEARHHRRSMQQELLSVLTDHASEVGRRRRAIDEAATVRAGVKADGSRRLTVMDSADLVREDRQR